ncbi:hypothetical protein Droror1_Dr00009849 [Drosera rotundifolia]
MTSSSTTYTPIPTAPQSSLVANLDYISRAKQRIYSTLATRRQWLEIFSYKSLSPLPHSFSDSLTRLRFNLSYFRVNFLLVGLVVLFLSLLWHPVSLIVFLLFFAAWLFLYFFRDAPVVVRSYEVPEWVVLVVLSVGTVVALVLTGVTVNVVASVGSVAVVVVVYSALRRIDDLYLDEETAAREGGGGVAARGGLARGGGLARVDESTSYA